MILEVQNLSFSYPQRTVLRDINLAIPEGRLVSLLGPNGTGKSTLFRCILNLLIGFQGKVLINEEDTSKISLAELAKLIAYIPQVHYPAFNYSVLDMVLMGTSAHLSAFSVPGIKELKRAQASLELLGIEELAQRNYMQISGGEQQLVLIARAISQDSKLLIMDEPTASLDFGNQVRVMQCIKNLVKQGYTILQATHNPNQAFAYSDQILAMQGGKIIADGTPEDVVNVELINELYGIKARVESLEEGRIRFCMPVEI
ncbi:MAG: ABC transporter ATP-binding protein [Christensenellales bacterium]|jgi:iron complex transport system ATP-binding protein|nr:ABC transporter ATP-binding protein [Christensenellaceae bacterium]